MQKEFDELEKQINRLKKEIAANEFDFGSPEVLGNKNVLDNLRVVYERNKQLLEQTEKRYEVVFGELAGLQ